MDINTTANLSDYYSQLAKNANASAISSKLSEAAGKNATDDELMDVCKQFESYLLEQVYKNMEKTATILVRKKITSLLIILKILPFRR